MKLIVCPTQYDHSMDSTKVHPARRASKLDKSAITSESDRLHAAFAQRQERKKQRRRSSDGDEKIAEERWRGLVHRAGGRGSTHTHGLAKEMLAQGSHMMERATRVFSSATNRLKGGINTISREELRQLRAAFDEMDINGNGELELEELHTLMATLGMPATWPEIQAMLDEFDTDHSGDLSFNEFVVALRCGSIGQASMARRRMNALTHKVAARRVTAQHKVVGGSRFMFLPFTTAYKLWEMLIRGLLMLAIIEVPVSLAFPGFRSSACFYHIAVDVLFMLDLAVQANTALFDFTSNGFPVVLCDRREVLRRYATSWFAVDLIAALPFGTSDRLRLRALKLVKCLKLGASSRAAGALPSSSTLHHLLTRLEDHRTVLSLLELLRLASIAVLVAHWMGCMNFMLCRSYGEPGSQDEDSDASAWAFPEDSWVSVTNLDLQNEWVQYEWSLFKALCLMLMMGFANPPPMNSHCSVSASINGAFLSHWCQVESWISLICLAIGSLFYVLLIANVTDTVRTMHQARRQYNDKIALITDYMRAKELPAQLRAKILRYFHQCYANGEAFDEHRVLLELKEGAPELMREIMLFNCGSLTLLYFILLRSLPLTLSLHAFLAVFTGRSRCILRRQAFT